MGQFYCFNLSFDFQIQDAAKKEKTQGGGSQMLQANVLCGLLASKRTYVQKAASADGGGVGCF